MLFKECFYLTEDFVVISFHQDIPMTNRHSSFSSFPFHWVWAKNYRRSHNKSGNSPCAYTHAQMCFHFISIFLQTHFESTTYLQQLFIYTQRSDHSLFVCLCSSYFCFKHGQLSDCLLASSTKTRVFFVLSKHLSRRGGKTRGKLFSFFCDFSGDKLRVRIRDKQTWLFSPFPINIWKYRAKLYILHSSSMFPDSLSSYACVFTLIFVCLLCGLSFKQLWGDRLLAACSSVGVVHVQSIHIHELRISLLSCCCCCLFFYLALSSCS